MLLLLVKDVALALAACGLAREASSFCRQPCILQLQVHFTQALYLYVHPAGGVQSSYCIARPARAAVSACQCVNLS